MSVLAPPAADWNLTRHTVIAFHGPADDITSSDALARLADQVTADGGTVTRIGGTETLHDGLTALFSALDAAVADPSRRHLVAVDGLGTLLRGDGSSTVNEFDVALAILIGMTERSELRVVVAVPADLARLAPLTAFALRRASQLVA